MQRELIIVLLAAVCSAGAQENRRPTQGRTANASAEPVTRINKSSTLIGTEVRTHDNQRIGEVHDVVFDINSGRIAYYVVDAREAINRDNSLIAVPPFAVQSTPREGALVLNADLQKIEGLRTFSPNNYPAIRGSVAQRTRWNDLDAQRSGNTQASTLSRRQNRSTIPQNASRSDDWHIHEWFLITPENKVSGEESQRQRHQQTRQDTRQRQQASGSPYGYSDYSGGDHGSDGAILEDRYSSIWEQNDHNATGGTRGIESAQQRSNDSQESSDASTAQSRTFYGQIKDINYEDQRLIVESDRKTLIFELAPAAQLRLNKGETTRFNHFHEGQWVEIKFRYQDGSNVAYSVAETGYIAPNK